ncbi:hypothetical protein [Ancrocorticia populi]|uniref:Uncharacterized protein n=1 Tax=Ancrocorticia populi TaxID=2175228 RepID=A0A2V1K6P3_9ACTO|nr:hypothetical protein [Ancrocorticia populi]PWF26662.1 hypothetical protein DD236_05070 [Ancrocorticia populi]
MFASALASLGAAIGTNRFVESSPGSFESWERTSFSGQELTLTEGLVASAGMIAAAASVSGRAKIGALASVGAGAVAGYVDDQMEDRFPAKGKGFHGHLGALRQGKLTSGAVKIGVIGLGASAGAATLATEQGALRKLGGWLVRTGLIAGTANFVNLLDLRPGRAIKASAAASVPLALRSNPGSGLAAGVIATGAVCARDDLAGRAMLGDMGANAMGAGLGFALASSPSAALRVGALACVGGLTLLSERVSFSKVIEENPVLSRIDQFGRP